MARGSRVPSGVFSYNDMGKSSNLGGKNYPEDIASGLELGGKLEGSNPPLVGQKGGSSSFPDAMVAEDGKANLGTKYVSMMGSGVGDAPGGTGSKNARMVDGVISYDGTGAKNSISKP